KQGEEIVGSRARVKVVKNKVAPPFRQAEFDMMHGQGVNRLGEVVDLASEKGIIDKSGSWYSYKGERIGQGRDNSMKFLAENLDIQAAITKELLAFHGIGADAAAATAEKIAAETKAQKESAESD